MAALVRRGIRFLGMDRLETGGPYQVLGKHSWNRTRRPRWSAEPLTSDLLVIPRPPIVILLVRRLQHVRCRAREAGEHPASGEGVVEPGNRVVAARRATATAGLPGGPDSRAKIADDVSARAPIVALGLSGGPDDGRLCGSSVQVSVAWRESRHGPAPMTKH